MSSPKFIKTVEGTLVNLAHVRTITAPTLENGHHVIKAKLGDCYDQAEMVIIASGAQEQMWEMYQGIILFFGMGNSVFDAKDRLELLQKGWKVF